MAEKYQLKNGLTVLLVESHKSPVVSVQMWVRTGSADEQEGQEGISHFIEHLVFKGTEKFAVGEVASQVESHGGEINAYTSFDQTVFYVTISKQFAEKGLDVISQMMGFPSFVGEEIDNERGVVIEEIKRGRDSAPRQASRMMFSTIYEKHPYGLPVIGYEEIIEKVTREEIVEYYESRYVPDNMTLLIVGDFSSEQIKGDVEKYFGSFKPHTLKEVTRPREPEQTSPRVVVKESNFEESYLFLTWRGPNVHHEDVIGLDVLSMILGQGESSRLMKSLRIEEPITNYTTSGTYTPINEGFLAIQSSLNEKNLNLALEKILAEVKTILTEPPSIDEMVKALTNLESERYYSLETVDGMANTYGTYERLFDDYEHYKIILDQARNLTTADLTQLARKYMKPETLSLCLMTNAEDLDSCKFINRPHQLKIMLLKKCHFRRWRGRRIKIKTKNLEK